MNNKTLLKILMNPVDAAGKAVELTNRQNEAKKKLIRQLLRKEPEK